MPPRYQTENCEIVPSPALLQVSPLDEWSQVPDARFADVASHVNRFYEQLHGEDRRTTNPSAVIEAAWAAATTP